MNNFNTSDKKILEVKNICKTYQSKNGEVEALKNINFDFLEEIEDIFVCKRGRIHKHYRTKWMW